MAAPLITAAVITRNEAANIQDCLASLAWADDRLVMDSLSTDTTVALAQAAGARVVQRPFDTYARQRNATLDAATGDWVVFVDADERVSPELGAEVRQAVTLACVSAAGFWVPRRNIILGRWVQHAGWWPDQQLRVLRRGRARYDETQDPHEVVVLDGAASRLTQTLTHLNYTSVGQLFEKQDRYARREAQTLSRQGVRALPHRFVTQPVREFLRRYVQLKGYKEGRLGLLLAFVMAWYRFRVYAHLARANRQPLTP